jgi:hypothetical protein
MEETFARTGLIKKKKKKKGKNRPQALHQAVLMAQPLSFFWPPGGAGVRISPVFQRLFL